MTQLLYLDCEATGVDEADCLLQVAYQTTDYISGNELFKPPLPIKLPAMAVHHVTEAMVADKPAFKDSETCAVLKDLAKQGYILVAHNAKYDVSMLKKEGIEFNKVICTYKLARYLDDGTMENHQMQYLRYYYGIDVRAVAHDALGDITVLEQVFNKLTEALIKKDFPSIMLVGDEVHNRMLEITQMPSLIKKFGFGKYFGKSLEEVAKDDSGYLQWLLDQKKQNPKGEEDWIFTLNHYLNK